MSDQAAAIVGAIIGFQSSALIFLAYSLSRFRERLARLEQSVEDHHRRCDARKGP